MKIKLVIFDMDGLMFDTGRLSYKAYVEAAKKYNFTISPNVYYLLTGRRDKEIRDIMYLLYGSECNVQEWRDYINVARNSILKKEQRVYKKKGLLEILEFLKKNDFIIAVASSNSMKKIRYYFQIENMPNFFDYVVSGENVVNGKPDPEIFMKACYMANISPNESLVLEDSFAGVKAAINGNFNVFNIPDNINDLPSVFGEYNLKIDPLSLVENIPNSVLKFDDLIEVMRYIQEKCFI